MIRKASKKCFGIIGGLGAIAGADLFFKLVKATLANGGNEQFDIVFEQHPFDEADVAGGENANPNGRKLYIFDLIKQFEQRKVDVVIVPCFISHTFIDELKSELKLPIVNLMEALRAHLERRYPEQSRLGVLTSTYVRNKGLFEQYFDEKKYALLYPEQRVQEQCMMPAIYGRDGIKAGHLQGESVELLFEACKDLLRQGAQLIVPGCTEIAIVTDALRERGIPIVDPNQAYVQYAMTHESIAPVRAFKLGVIGGVGPAATVDFMSKIIRNTPAGRDQDHIKLVLEHNPQIPDRTDNLVGSGADPTVAIYSACKKLEADDADLIAIPCNTAHAFVERIQPYLSIPIVNMLFETAAYIGKHHTACKTIGLLATSGTIASRVYHEAVAAAGLKLIVPEDALQEKVMSAIYGERGVKAGYTDGVCRDELHDAIEHLVRRGAEVIVLGCTELPLLLTQTEDFPVGDKHVVVLDPTEILARKCVSLAL